MNDDILEIYDNSYSITASVNTTNLQLMYSYQYIGNIVGFIYHKLYKLNKIRNIDIYIYVLSNNGNEGVIIFHWKSLSNSDKYVYIDYLSNNFLFTYNSGSSTNIRSLALKDIIGALPNIEPSRIKYNDPMNNTYYLDNKIYYNDVKVLDDNMYIMSEDDNAPEERTPFLTTNNEIIGGLKEVSLSDKINEIETILSTRHGSITSGLDIYNDNGFDIPGTYVTSSKTIESCYRPTTDGTSLFYISNGSYTSSTASFSDYTSYCNAVCDSNKTDYYFQMTFPVYINNGVITQAQLFHLNKYYILPIVVNDGNGIIFQKTTTYSNFIDSVLNIGGYNKVLSSPGSGTNNITYQNIYIPESSYLIDIACCIHVEEFGNIDNAYPTINMSFAGHNSILGDIALPSKVRGRYYLHSMYIYTKGIDSGEDLSLGFYDYPGNIITKFTVESPIVFTLVDLCTVNL